MSCNPQNSDWWTEQSYGEFDCPDFGNAVQYRGIHNTTAVGSDARIKVLVPNLLNCVWAVALNCRIVLVPAAPGSPLSLIIISTKVVKNEGRDVATF